MKTVKLQSYHALLQSLHWLQVSFTSAGTQGPIPDKFNLTCRCLDTLRAVLQRSVPHQNWKQRGYQLSIMQMRLRRVQFRAPDGTEKREQEA